MHLVELCGFVAHLHNENLVGARLAELFILRPPFRDIHGRATLVDECRRISNLGEQVVAQRLQVGNDNILNLVFRIDKVCIKLCANGDDIIDVHLQRAVGFGHQSHRSCVAEKQVLALAYIEVAVGTNKFGVAARADGTGHLKCRDG